MSSLHEVYITGVGKFLPGEPIPNQAMSSYIGSISKRSSRLGSAILRQNGIKHRFYALDTDGGYRYTNAAMAAHAIHDALRQARCQPEQVDMLATSTTQGDYLVPGFASAVHAELGIPPLAIFSFQSVCASSLMAIKNAWLNVKVGESQLAIASGSEFASRWFRPAVYQPFYDQDSKPDPQIEFLRWTLSDGAGAVVLESHPKPDGLSLRIDWIQLKSFADRFPPCMYAGAKGNSDADNLGWGLYPSPQAAYEAGAIALKQDFNILYAMFPVWVGYYLELLEKYGLDPETIDYFLPHYSSHSLGEEMKRLLRRTGAMIAEDKWCNNLEHCGNTGTASIFIMLEELVRQHALQPGQRVLCFVPESGRCIAAFMHLTVV